MRKLCILFMVCLTVMLTLSIILTRVASGQCTDSNGQPICNFDCTCSHPGETQWRNIYDNKWIGPASYPKGVTYCRGNDIAQDYDDYDIYEKKDQEQVCTGPYFEGFDPLLFWIPRCRCEWTDIGDPVTSTYEKFKGTSTTTIPCPEGKICSGSPARCQCPAGQIVCNGICQIPIICAECETGGGCSPCVPIPDCPPPPPPPPPPNAITLDSFTAAERVGSILLKWETLSELNNAGFHLWRSESEEGEYTRITVSLIPAEGGSTLCAEYSYTDYTAKPGVTYYYKLEDIDTNGVSIFHGPVSTVIPATTTTRQPAGLIMVPPGLDGTRSHYGRWPSLYSTQYPFWWPNWHNPVGGKE